MAPERERSAVKRTSLTAVSHLGLGTRQPAEGAQSLVALRLGSLVVQRAARDEHVEDFGVADLPAVGTLHDKRSQIEANRRWSAVQPDGVNGRSRARSTHDEAVAPICHVGVLAPDTVGLTGQEPRPLSFRQHDLLARVQREAQLVGGVDTHSLGVVHGRRLPPDDLRRVRRDEALPSIHLQRPVHQQPAPAAMACSRSSLMQRYRFQINYFSGMYADVMTVAVTESGAKNLVYVSNTEPGRSMTAVDPDSAQTAGSVACYAGYASGWQ